MKKIVFFILSLFLVTGCIPQPKALIERDTVELNTTVFNRSFKEKLPVVKKMPFGDIAILGATVASDTKGDRLSVKANITFKNFQIPEGLGGGRGVRCRIEIRPVRQKSLSRRYETDSSQFRKFDSRQIYSKYDETLHSFDSGWRAHSDSSRSGDYRQRSFDRRKDRGRQWLGGDRFREVTLRRGVPSSPELSSLHRTSLHSIPFIRYLGKISKRLVPPTKLPEGILLGSGPSQGDRLDDSIYS